MLNIAEPFKTKGIAITQLDRLDGGDRSVIDNEPFPLPRCG